jgi:serine/threonine protein kinase
MHIIRADELTDQKLLGSGNYGEVTKGRYGDMDVAIKSPVVVASSSGSPTLAGAAGPSRTAKAKCTNQQCPNKNNTQMRELAVIVSVPPHPNVMPILGAVVDEDKLRIIMRLVDGSVDDILQKQPALSKDVVWVKALLMDTVSGLVHLHLHKIIHRDMGWRNVLMDAMRARISDFGLSRDLRDESQYLMLSNDAVAWQSLAPESLNPQQHEFLPASDVWMFGVMLFELLVGTAPFGDKNYGEMCVLADKQQLRLPMTKWPKHCPMAQADWQKVLSDMAAAAALVSVSSGKTTRLGGV